VFVSKTSRIILYQTQALSA